MEAKPPSAMPPHCDAVQIDITACRESGLAGTDTSKILGRVTPGLEVPGLPGLVGEMSSHADEPPRTHLGCQGPGETGGIATRAVIDNGN